jgi:uncharacterized membrane protein
MRVVSFIFVSVLIVALANSASGADKCRACIKDKAAGMRDQVVAATLLGTLGGLTTLTPAGAICGAVIGAVGGATSKLIDISQCADICKAEALQEGDSQAAKCQDLLTQ